MSESPRTPPTRLIEACVDSVESARAAIAGGADRLELCANLVLGGTTPTTGLLARVLEVATQTGDEAPTPVRCLVRPRAGDYLYDADDVRVMEGDVAALVGAGASGVVVGALDADGGLDLGCLEGLVDAAEGAGVTLHRAFDECADPSLALEQAVSLGVDTILTSGQAPVASEGLDLLGRLVTQAGGRVRILVASGVDASLIARCVSATGATCYHLSGKTVAQSGMRHRHELAGGAGPLGEYERYVTSERAIRDARCALDEALARLA